MWVVFVAALAATTLVCVSRGPSYRPPKKSVIAFMAKQGTPCSVPL